jgi:hypothetical protein
MWIEMNAKLPGRRQDKARVAAQADGLGKARNEGLASPRQFPSGLTSRDATPRPVTALHLNPRGSL